MDGDFTFASVKHVAILTKILIGMLISVNKKIRIVLIIQQLFFQHDEKEDKYRQELTKWKDLVDELKSQNSELRRQVDPTTLPAQQEIKQITAKVPTTSLSY